MAGSNGGVFFVQERYAEQFIDEYVKFIKSNTRPPLFLNELRTPIFRFVFDLDFAQAYVLTKEHEILLYQTMFKALRKFYPDHLPDKTFDCIVTAAEDMQYPATDARHPNWFKFGRHGCFPNLHVNDQIAATLREGILAAIDEVPALARTEDCNGWTDVLDASIYGPNGLRMAYSHKPEKCRACKGDEVLKLDCLKCYGLVTIDLGRVYVPHMALRRGTPSERALQHLKHPIHGVLNTVKQTSLRLPSDAQLTPGFKAYANCPVPRIGEHVVQVELGDGTRVMEFKEDFKARQRFKNYLSVPPKSLEWNTVQEYIRRHLPDAYKRVRVHEIQYPRNLAFYHVLLQGIGCNYCMNIGGNHRRNTAYFVFYPSGVTQKCHCRCDTVDGRKYGLCSKYESQKFGLPTQSRDILFPSSQANKAGSLEMTRNMEKRLSRNEYYVAVKNVVSRLAELIQVSNKAQAADEELKKVQVVSNAKKIVKDKPPPKKKRKVATAAPPPLPASEEDFMEWS